MREEVSSIEVRFEPNEEQSPQILRPIVQLFYWEFDIHPYHVISYYVSKMIQTLEPKGHIGTY